MFEKWTKEVYEEHVVKKLKELADEQYLVFHQKLVPGTDNLLGVRLPEIKKLAKNKKQL